MRFNLIISTGVQNLRTFPTPTIILLKCKGYVELMVREYRGKYCKPSFTVRKQQVEYGEYSDLIYSAHILTTELVFFYLLLYL